MKLIKTIHQLIDQFNYHRHHTDETVHPTATPKAPGFASPEIAGGALHTRPIEQVDNVFKTSGGERFFVADTNNKAPINSGLTYLTTYKMDEAEMWLATHSYSGSVFIANKHQTPTSPLPQKQWRSLTTSLPIVGLGNSSIKLSNPTFKIDKKQGLNSVNYKILYGFGGVWKTVTLTKYSFIRDETVNIPLYITMPQRGGSTIRVSFSLSVDPTGTATLSKNFIENVSATGEVTDINNRDNDFEILRVFEEYGQDLNMAEFNNQLN